MYAQGLPGEIEFIVLDAMREQHDKYVAVGQLRRTSRARCLATMMRLEWYGGPPHRRDGCRVGQTFEQWGVIAQVAPLDREAHAQLAYAMAARSSTCIRLSSWPTRRLFDIPAWFIEGDATFFELEHV